MTYCSTDDVYAATKLSSTVVPESSITAFISAAERYVDLKTFTTYHALEVSGTADSSDSTSITDDEATWTVNAYANMYVWIFGGTGATQFRKILSNTSDTLTVDTAWGTNPDNTSTYRIVYTASNPNVSESMDGTGNSTFFLDSYPLLNVQSLSIADIAVTVSSLYVYERLGKIMLSKTSEVRYFYMYEPQQVDLNFWYGVYPLPAEVKRFTIVQAALSTLAAQVGGTYATPSTYTLPEVSLSIGQAYVNIRETFNSLLKEAQALEPILQKYMTIA